MRWCALLIVAAGCDHVFLDEHRTADSSRESDTHDEDGDGIADRGDLCPHLPSPQQDTDGDNVGDDCDPRIDVRDGGRFFFAFERGDTTGVGLEGIAMKDNDAIAIGTETSESQITLDVSTTTAMIAAGLFVADVSTTSPVEVSSPDRGSCGLRDRRALLRGTRAGRVRYAIAACVAKS